jgi:hypothetical protein
MSGPSCGGTVVALHTVAKVLARTRAKGITRNKSSSSHRGSKVPTSILHSNGNSSQAVAYHQAEYVLNDNYRNSPFKPIFCISWNVLLF